jgi:very-short-patch-repair endonuclease
MIYSRIIVEAKQNLGASGNIMEKAKALRKNLTPSEKKLWNSIRKRQLNGLHFRRQHPYGIYILDFYCFKANLAIEIDGPIHLKKVKYDLERTKYIESSGLNVLHFKNDDIDNRMEWVLNKIKSSLIFSPLGETGKGVDKSV